MLASGSRFSMPPPTRNDAEPQPSSSEIPIDPDDAIWGSAVAPVTIVVFTDLECPYCAEGHSALTQLSRHYGSERLRIAVKHCPLAMHPQAIPAARVAQAVLELGGRQKFFEYLDLVYARRTTVARGDILSLIDELGLDQDKVRTLAASTQIGEQIISDVDLANRLGVTATPHLRINGVPVTGAVPFSTLEPVIEEELREAARLRESGIAPNDIYARRVAKNFAL